MKKKRIVFVCIENARRSQMAQGFAEALGQGEKVKNHIFAIVLLLSAFLFSNVCLLSAGTLPQSITILYSNNINAEIDPCPS
jgi:hypothetical protein